MQLEQVAKAFKELGHPTRLAIFKRVVKAGRQGMPVGEIQQQLQVPGSTLSHHIAGLVSATLVSQRREGRTLYCVAAYDQLESVIHYLQDECCSDEPTTTEAP
ncbi:helix-turn-helix transcriptional regulator [Verrucomicrobiaceae bacterium N1E253]|uniref:Helix-turn-helix transcriptional regulator n=1 Tax=Oceaniferula marina TaxID=2748318 RepID=A0A851GBF1_9BACT|nr:metalloregulator ArsR/SmtB family transcription factor [Oceaniferula marina]NWK54499.1 helix-turn-helix transcriptional regulator [Oceaniferula marina]